MKLERPGSVVLLVAAFGVFAALLMPRVIQIEKLKSRSTRLEAELKKIRLENKRLETELKLLREDPVYLEKVARDKFNKAKEGEIVYKVVRPEADGAPAPPEH